MKDDDLTWEHDLTTALMRAERDRRFIMADFGKEP